MILTRRSFVTCSLAASALPAPAQDAPLVFAAASLKGVLDRVAVEVAPLRLSYGGSGAMARQIIAGAPAYIYLSANPVWTEAVADKLPLLERHDLLGNDLVLVGSAREATDANYREAPIAMGFLSSVPAGQYGKAVFEALGVWDQLRPNVIEVESVSAALAMVARGAVPFGVVYATDALAEPRVRVLERFPGHLHPEIRYPMALLQERGRAGFEALKSEAAQAIYRDAGFAVL
ncbi:MAG: molybdate ABC transporter substrate-binding protein [Pseudomonadota bacterium]